MISLAKTLVNFRLEESEKEKLDQFCQENGYKVSEFIRDAINRCMGNPKILRGIYPNETSNLATKNDLSAIGADLSRLLGEWNRSRENLLFFYHQKEAEKEASGKTELIREFKERLLSNESKEQLTTYKDIQNYLLTEFPQLEKEIVEDKLYNDAVSHLMAEDKVSYNVRTKKLIWK